MVEPWQPACEREVADGVVAALAAGDRLAIAGGGSKAAIGRAVEVRRMEMGGLTGIVDYDPAELVLTLRPGTPLAEVQSLVAGARQMLAFEPFDHGPMFGGTEGKATIGGIVAAGVGGSRRLSAGGVRDHVLGIRAVSGRGELFVAGAKVVKNVTGYDLPKLVTGSWGRLCAVTELTLKVLPRPEQRTTWFVAGLDDAAAVRVMAAAMGSQAEVACAAHRPARVGGEPLTALRLEGFAPSVRARGEVLARLLAQHGMVERPSEDEAEAYWADFVTLSPLPREPALWRINIAPSAAPELLEALAPAGAKWMLDWAGGLVFLASHGAAETVRTAASRAGGHATLLRADSATRDKVSAFHPPEPGLARLEERVRRAFDPAGVFETGRF